MQGNELRFLRNIGNLLRDDKIHFPIHTVPKQPAPFRSIFHVWCGGAFINIEINQFPIGTQSNGIDKALLVKIKVVVIPRLIEISDIDANDIVNITLHFFLKDVRPMLPLVMKHNTVVA